MAEGLQIGQLPQKENLTGNELIPFQQGSSNGSMSTATLKKYIGTGGGTGGSTDYMNYITEYNVSVQHPTSGIGGSNKYSLEGAIAQVPQELRNIGLKVSFINSNGKVETWEFDEGIFTNIDSWREVGSQKITELELLANHEKEELNEKTIVGYYIQKRQTGGILLASGSKNIALFPISGYDSMRIEIPQSASSASLSYAYADTLDDTVLTVPVPPVFGSMEAQTIDVDLTDITHPYVAVCYTSASGIPTVIGKMKQLKKEDVNEEFKKLIPPYGNRIDKIEGVIERLNIESILPVERSIEKQYVTFSGKLAKSDSRTTAIYKISGMSNYDIHIPKSGSGYGVSYSYLKRLDDSLFIIPDSYEVGDTKEQNFHIENDGLYPYMAIVYTTDGGVPVITGHRTFVSEIEADIIAKEVAERQSIKDMDSLYKSTANLRMADIRDKARPLRIMWIGNSFADLSIKLLPNLFKSIGYEVTLGVSYKGGGTLEQYDTDKDKFNSNTFLPYLKYKNSVWVNNNYVTAPKKYLADMITDENWDVIFLQQGSKDAGAFNKYEPHFQNLIDWLAEKTLSIGYRIGWLMPWAWADSYFSDHADASGATNNATMYANICSATSEHISKYDAINIFSPCGTAVQNMQNYYSQDELYTDGIHVGVNGYTSSSITLFDRIANYMLGMGIDNVEFNNNFGISEDLYNKSVKAAKAAIESPFEKTVF